jgi:hypothetical protein
MIASQLGHLTGLPVPHGSVLAQLGMSSRTFRRSIRRR